MDNQRVNMLRTRWFSENQPTLFDKSDLEILELNSAIHAPGDDQTSLNVESIFHDANAGVSDVTERIDSVVKGYGFGTPIVPFHTSPSQCSAILLHRMSIGGRGDMRTILEPCAILVLVELSMYSWEAKVVMALSIFAQNYSSMCSKLLVILQQVPESSTNPAVVLNRQGRIVILNNLVKANLQLIDHTLKLKNVPKDIPSLDSAMIHIPLYVFWSIISMMACQTEAIRLTSFDEKNCYGLDQFSEKINSIIKNLEIVQEEQAKKLGGQYISPRKQKMYRILTGTASDSAKKFSNLIFHDDHHIHIGVKLTGNQETRKIDIDECLSQRYLFLFFTPIQICKSDIQIFESDIEHLTKLQDGKKKDKEKNIVVKPYKIIWVPVKQDKWTPDDEANYGIWKRRMHWYCVFYNNPHKKSIKKIKELGFNDKFMLTVINPLGQVEEANAIQKLRAKKGSIEAFTCLFQKP